MDTATLSKLVVFLGKTDGRDKFAKFLQNYCRYRKYYATGDSAKQFKALQSSLSEFRSWIKFGKQAKAVQEVNVLVGSKPPGGLTVWNQLKLFALVSDIGYKFGDNVEFLSKYKLLSFDEERMEKISKTFQFFAYLIDAFTGLRELALLQRKSFETKEDYLKERKKMLIGVVGDWADFLRVTPGFCEMYGGIGVLKKHDGFSGAMGVVVGIMGCWKVWLKCMA